MSNDVYKRKTESERQAMFAKLAHDIGHVVINITPPTDKSKIKEIRKAHGLNGKDAADICGVSRRTWTLWENYRKEGDDLIEAYPNDWQWGWFLLAINKHPNLRLVEQDKTATA